MSVISEIKQIIDIVELVSEYIPLQKAGRNFKGLCPFHSEKHPSFFVFPEQQTWHCFGACGSGGDVFSFLMKKLGLDFSQVLRLLAQKADVTLGPPGTLEKRKEEEDDGRIEKEKLFRINEAAAEFYHHLLLNAEEGKIAKGYLAKRKLTSETIKEFRLGLSPDSWEAAKKYLINKGYEERDLISGGLIIEKEGGGSYDRFRNRLMFPICDIQGHVTGFGARALDDSLPKYLNSPQTIVFDKGGTLYGIDKAIVAARKKNSLIIVEGYMDVLLLHQFGWQNVVASMGTSLTEKQVDIIKKLTRNILLALDADAAGEEAILRGMEVINRSGDKKVIPVPLCSGLVRYEGILDAEIKVITLPLNKDPDEVVSENPNLWQNLVGQALPILDFAFHTVVSKVDTDKAKDKSLAIQKLLPLIEEIKDPLRQAQYVQKLAHELKLSEPILLAYIRKAKSSGMKQKTTELAEKSRFSRHLASSVVEEYCLALLFQYPELHELTRELLPEHFQHTENRELFIQWQNCQDISHLQGELDTTLSEHLYYLLNKRFPPPLQQSAKKREFDFQACVLRLQEELSRTLQTAKKLTLELTREKEGSNAELTNPESSSGQQLKETFYREAKEIKQWTQSREKTRN